MPPPHHDHHHHHHHHPPHHPPHHDHHHHHHHHHVEEDPYKDKDWDELSKANQDAFATLGWTQTMWDEDGQAETEDYDWHDLSHEQRQAAESLGYHPKLWDEGHGHFHFHGHHHHDKPHHHHSPPHSPPHHHHKKEEEEKKDNHNDEDVDVGKLNIDDDDDDNDDKKNEKKKKPTFKVSPTFGGTGGDEFDHKNNRGISKITIYADKHVVRGIEMKYTHHTLKAGKTDTNLTVRSTEFQLQKGEFITQAVVRSNKYVQSLGFKTNKGRMLGPCGGNGWNKINVVGGDDTEGQEHTVPAPFKLQLVGLMGRASDNVIDQIAFRWGPIR